MVVIDFQIPEHAKRFMISIKDSVNHLILRMENEFDPNQVRTDFIILFAKLTKKVFYSITGEYFNGRCPESAGIKPNSQQSIQKR